MESVFQSVGTCGCFQVCHVFCIQLIRMVNAWCLCLMAFGNYEPPWECIQRNGTSNTSNASSPTSNGLGVTIDAVYNDNITTRSYSYQPAPNDTIWPPLTSSTNHDSFQSQQGTCDQLPLCDEIRFDPTSVTLVTEFGLICDQAYIPSLIIAVQMSGMVVGAYLGGQLGESYGRKVSIYLSLALMSAACFIAAWSVSWQMYACLIFFVGIGEGGITSCQFVYPMEFLTSRWRGRFAALPTWNVSLLLFALLVLVLKDLRHIHILTGIVSSLILLSALWVPESLRWLHVNGKYPQAKIVLKKMMKCNGRGENIDDIIHGLKEETSKDGEQIIKRYTYLDLFRNGGIRIVTLKALTVGFLLSMAYYTLSFSVKALSGDYYTNLLLSCGLELPFSFFVFPCVNRFGRKFTVTVLSGLGAICVLACVISYYATSYETSGPIITYLAIATKGFCSSAWNTNVIYAGELFPTAIRSLAMGLSNTVSRAGVILGAAIIPSDQESLVIFFIVLSVGMLVSCVIIVTLPETKGKPLEDVLEVTNNEDRDSGAAERVSIQVP